MGIIIVSAVDVVHSFQSSLILISTKHYPLIDIRLHAEENRNRGKYGKRSTGTDDRFLSDFKTADGNHIDPYKMLKLPRSATGAEIKQSYRRLSRQLHPDMVAQKDILPGKCTNLEDVRDEWEKVKLSYEILSDPKTRMNYDRNSVAAEVLNNPGGAVGRAVVGGAMSGIGLVLSGAWKLGEMATKKMYESTAAEKAKAPSKVLLSSTAPIENYLKETMDYFPGATVMESNETAMTPGTQGSVRYMSNYSPPSTTTEIDGSDSTNVALVEQIFMPTSAAPAPMTTTTNIDTSDNAPRSKSIRKKDAGFVDMNNMALLTPEPKPTSETKKTRKTYTKRGKKASAKLDQ